MKKIFITQIPHRTDAKTGAFVPSVNINTASEHGELIVIAPPRGGFYDANALKDLISESLMNFNNDSDCLLPLGDPTLCSAAAAFLGRRFDYFDVLRWDKTLGRYTKNRVVI
jgi:hypothetical protein